MKKAGAKEKAFAISNNQYHRGVPAITVMVDGGWCKRSHKHSYNAKSGVGIIIGKETGKILYLINIVQYATRQPIVQYLNIDAFVTGMNHHLPWRVT